MNPDRDGTDEGRAGVSGRRITIRPFLPADAGEVARVIATTMAVSNVPDYGEERMRPLIDRFTPEAVLELNRTRSCFVAEVEGTIAGTGALEEDELLSFFVLPRFQGQRIGTALLAVIEEEARRQGEGLLRVGASLAGAPFYEARGYRRTGALLEMSAGTHVAMVKEL